MSKPFQQTRIGTLSDDAVKEKTGRTWDEWFKILDKAGARMMEHRELSLLLEKRNGLDRWWSQMVAAGYETERGIRDIERNGPPGQQHEITLNKLIPVPRAAVWAAFHDPATLAQWLPNTRFEVGEADPPKLLHWHWPDGSNVMVRFYEQRNRARLALTHARLSESQADRMRLYWDHALEQLRVLLVG